jgi:hypothetical protein
MLGFRVCCIRLVFIRSPTNKIDRNDACLLTGIPWKDANAIMGTSPVSVGAGPEYKSLTPGWLTV